MYAKESSASYDVKKEYNITEYRAVRLLSRRYDLTNTGYKFLEIRIDIGPPSYVEIVLGDHRGHELSLSLETWKSLYQQRGNIYKLLSQMLQSVQTFKYSVKETMRENGEGMEGRLDSISQYTHRRIPVSRTHLFGPGIWINVPKGRYDICSEGQCELVLLFGSRNLILLTQDCTSCDLRRLKGKQCER
ncbi:hypothetical protein G5I_08748 [Acromyrmex echinatior]|uniref:Uncharacterized protein n=1 Tax=Acromyrmex echinatior TaxID=103372 RepID=F4WSC6_ACREC|nr:hypothetical protein G5I_08748 [Acromyrmex echinatior]